jgi:hypothetical protein
MEENRSDVANFLASLPGQKQPSSDMLPIVFTLPVPDGVAVMPEVKVKVDSHVAVADAEHRAEAAEARASRLKTQLTCVLRTVTDRLVADSTQVGMMDGPIVMVDRVERHTGLSRDELKAYHSDMDVACMNYHKPLREQHYERVPGW